jgi:hypothetical protein
MNQNGIARRKAERAEISREAAPRGDQLAAPA